MALTTLTINNTAGSFSLIDGTKFALVEDGWAPNVAELRRGELGGYSPYENVEETLTLDVIGSSPSVVMANIAELKRYLDQAERWSRGDNVNPVTLSLTITGVSGRAAVVYGGNVSMADNFAERVLVNEQEAISVRIVRSGWWIGTTDNATSSSFTQPAVRETVFSATHAPISPVTLSVNGFDGGTSDISFNTTTSWMIWAPTTSYFQISEAETGLVGGAGYTTTADAANLASGGNILRLNAASGVANYGTANVTITQKRIAVYAAIRNNAATEVRVRARLFAQGMRINTRWETIPASMGVSIVPFGEVETRDRFNWLEWEYASASGSANMDMDYFVLQGIDDDMTSGALQVLHGLQSDVIPAGAMFYRIAPRVDPNTVPRPTPEVTFYQGSTIVYAGYRGAPLPCATGDRMAVVFLATGGNSAAHWRFTNTSNAVVSNTITAARARAYVIPE